MKVIAISIVFLVDQTRGLRSVGRMREFGIFSAGQRVPWRKERMRLYVFIASLMKNEKGGDTRRVRNELLKIE